MEGSGAGISRLDCYEDMFKEITRKLYGEDPDHRTSSVQNEFETSVSYKGNDEDTENGTDGSDDTNWTCEDEPLKGTEGSRVAAYHAGKATWRCYECGDCMAGGPREVAEHFMELHSSRIIADDSGNRHHSSREDFLHMELKLEDVASYLEKIRERAERSATPLRRTQETQTVPAALLPPTSTFLLQELASAPAPQHQHQNSSAAMPTSAATTASTKRYTCPYCPYGSDRRDLYTRHEHIHREEKPFHCYVCYKPFNRADHVKKHFMRMHREHNYELARIRRPIGSSGTSKSLQLDSASGTTGNGSANYPTSSYNNNKSYQLQSTPASSGLYQATAMPAPGIMQPEAGCGRRVQNGGCNSKSHLKGGSKGAQERRYTCCYCTWSGVDNWCLKRHLNTHLKPFACALCEYKAARAERLATHVLKVHNRRQCSRCSFLGEDAAQLQVHQLHVHRVSSANAPATSAQPTPPPNSRHQQPLHPAGGGRPPPGPPVFPAPTPAIAPVTTVIPPTTILGHLRLSLAALYDTLDLDLLHACRGGCSHEMVNSPATAATMASPPEETQEASVDVTMHHNTALRSTRHVEHSDEEDSKRTLQRSIHEESTGRTGSDVRIKSETAIDVQLPNEKRSRKQSQPRKVTVQDVDEEDDKDDSFCRKDVVDEMSESMSTRRREKRRRRGRRKPRGELRDRYLAQLVSRRGSFKCHRCPRDASAKAFFWVPYHTKASLVLHTLWRHGRKKTVDKLEETPRSSSATFTLQATVYTTSSHCQYQR